MVATAVASAIKDADLQNDWCCYLYVIFQYGPLAIFLVLVVLASFDLFLRRLAGTGIIQERLLLDGYYYTNGNYTLLKRVYCVNDSNQPTRNLLEIKEGYHEEPVDVKASCGPLGPNSSHAIALSDPPVVERQRHNVAGVDTEVFKYQWHASFRPPIDAGERFSFFVRVAAQGVEKKAFRSEGTLFSWLIETRTYEMQISIHAPCGYVVKPTAHSVGNEKGQVVMEELRAVARPRTVADGTLLQWRILLPRPQLRYGLRYTIEKLGD